MNRRISRDEDRKYKFENMNHIRDHVPKPKSVLKIPGNICKKTKGIKSLIESSFQVAHKVTKESSKPKRLSELTYTDADFNDDSSEDEGRLSERGIERNLSSSLTVSTFKKLQCRRRIKVVAIFSDTDGPQIALQQLSNVCETMDTELIEIKFDKLDYGEYTVLDTFYNADVSVVDMSVLSEQASLCYHLGVRESTGMKDNIVVVEDVSVDKTRRLKVYIMSMSYVIIWMLVNADLGILSLWYPNLFHVVFLPFSFWR